MSSTALPSETTAMFIRLGDAPSFPKCEKSNPYETVGSYHALVKKIAALNPREVLGNVCITHFASSPPLYRRGSREETTFFFHPEVSADQMGEILKCCKPDANSNKEEVQRCWNRVLPGNLSDYNR